MHFMTRLAVCLLVGLPTLGSAQTADAPIASPETSTPPLVTAPPEASPGPSESEPPPSRGEVFPRQINTDNSGLMVPRILAGTTLGTLAGAGGAIVGLVGGVILTDCGLIESSCTDSDDFKIVTAAALGAGTISALTVYGMGSLFRGNGNFVATMLGGLAGAGAAMVVFQASDSGTAALLMPAMAAVGAVIAYEVSNPLEEPRPPPHLNADRNLQLTPVFSATPAGGVLGGLVGRF